MDLFSGFNSCKPGFNSSIKNSYYDKMIESKIDKWHEFDDKVYDLSVKEYNKFIYGYHYIPKLNSMNDQNIDDNINKDDLNDFNPYNIFDHDKNDDFSDLKEDLGYSSYEDDEDFIDEISDDECELEYYNDFIEWEIH